MFNNIKIKHRHILTAAGNIRLRYVIVILLLCISLLWFGIGKNNDNSDVDSVNVQHNIITDIIPEVLLPKSYDPEVAGNGIAPFLDRIGMRPYFDKPYILTSTRQIKSGDSLGVLIEETGLKGDNYFGAMKAIKKYVDARDLRPKHKILISTELYKNSKTVKEISYVYDSLTSVIVTKNATGKWQSVKKERPVSIKTYAAKTTIKSSLFADLGKAGVPTGIINKMIKAYSWSVDFQRDIWGNEDVEVLYETKETEDGQYVRSNRLLYANLKLRRKEMPIYLYEKDKGYPNYFEPNGQSIRRALMKTPIDGARLSSGYGRRRHPVLGYNKMHKGVDFAAPTGTPVYAAGDGTILRASRFSSFGNYVKIRHNDTYTTAYAHLHKFAKGIGKGSRVKQGQIIAYVGTTGRSTGPHLHYEVHKNGRHVNPHSVDLPIGEKLKGNKFTKFKTVVKERIAEFKVLLK